MIIHSKIRCCTEGSRCVLSLVFFVLLFLLFTSRGIAQTTTQTALQKSLPGNISLQVNILTAKQGLTSREITTAVQDKYGFLWFGTQNGLFRWDGIKMTAFTAQRSDTTAIPSNGILHLHEDKRGTLWIATDAGLAQFRRHNNTFSTAFGGKAVADVHEDSRGKLWCWIHTPTVKADEICLYDPETGAEICFKEGTQGLRSAYLYAFAETKGGVVWLGTTNGLHRFDREKGVFTAFLTDALSGQSPAKSQEAHILSLTADNNGVLFVGTGKGLFCGKTPTNELFEPFAGANSTPLLRESAILLLQKNDNGKIFAGTMRRAASNDAVNTLLWIRLADGMMSNAVAAVPIEGKAQSHRAVFDAKGNLWWGAANGAILLQPNTMQSITMLAESRITTPVTAILAARSGAVFLARLNGGVSAVLPPRQPFRTVPNLLSENISALGESPDGTVWIGYMGGSGVSRLDRKINTMTHFCQDPTNPASISGFKGETNIYTFHADRSGKWRVGSYFLERFTGSGFRRTPLLDNALAPATAIAEDKQGNIWVGSTFGLFLTDAEGKVLQHYTHNPKNDAMLSNNNIHALLHDRANTLWIGHDAGVDRLKISSHSRSGLAEQRFTRLNAASNLALHRTFGAVTSFSEDATGRIWVGGRGGVFCFDPATGAMVRHLTERDGLWENAVAGLCEDKRGNIWISSRRGLCRYNPIIQVLTRFSATDGIADEEFADGAALCTKDGTLWFGARNAVVMVHPDSIQEQSASLSAILTGLKKFGEPATFDTYIADTPSIELSHEDKVITFEYAVPGALYADKLQYSYKLEGLDTAWSKAGTEREAKYTALPVGEYTFFVRASNENGIWQQTPTSIRVTVHPPLWQTWWFRLGAALVLVLSVYMFFRWRVRQMQKRNSELELQVSARTAELNKANSELSLANEDLNIANTQVQVKNQELAENLEILRKTQKQLVESEKMAALGTLVTGVAHELNTPIGVALTAASTMQSRTKRFLERLERNEPLLKKELRDFTTDATEGAGITLQNLARASDLIQSFKHIAVDQHSDQQRRFRLAAYLGELAASLSPQIKGTKHRMEIECAEDIEMVSYPGVIAQIITNFVVNSLLHGFKDFTDAGIISIRAERTTPSAQTISEYVIIRYTDNGRGIPPEILPRIYDPFFTTKQAQGGTGLGLNIVYNLVTQKLGGTLVCESIPEKETLFTVTVPMEMAVKANNS